MEKHVLLNVAFWKESVEPKQCSSTVREHSTPPYVFLFYYEPVLEEKLWNVKGLPGCTCHSCCVYWGDSFILYFKHGNKSRLSICLVMFGHHLWNYIRQCVILWNIYISIKVFDQDKAFLLILKQKRNYLKIQQEKYFCMLFWYLVGKTKFMSLQLQYSRQVINCFFFLSFWGNCS